MPELNPAVLLIDAGSSASASALRPPSWLVLARSPATRNAAGQNTTIATCGPKNKGHGCKEQMFGSEKQVRGKGRAV
jgi:hypothetical protein